MQFIRVFNPRENTIVQLVVQPADVIQAQYFERTFPGATGIRYRVNDLNEFRSIPLDVNGNFLWQWDSNILYEVIYPGGTASLSTSSSSSRAKFRSWFNIAASILVVWIGSILCSMWSNVYEDSIKYLFANASEPIDMQSFHLRKRAAIVMICSLLYIVLINTLTALLMKIMWKKIKDWIENIDIDRLTYNPLAPR